MKKVKSFIRSLKRIYYRAQYIHSGIAEMIHGKFRVKYKDGKRSVRMYYRNAKNYQEIFGGEIVELF